MRVIHVIRKAGATPVARNVIEHGTGSINVDATRLPTTEIWKGQVTNSPPSVALSGGADGSLNNRSSDSHPGGRWPTNVILQGIANVLDAQTGERPSTLTGRADPANLLPHPGTQTKARGLFTGIGGAVGYVYADSGGASRFFKVIE